MQVNSALEERLWKITRPNPLDKNEFVEIIEYVFKRLIDYLQQPLEVIGEDYIDDDAFCRRNFKTGGYIVICWRRFFTNFHIRLIWKWSIWKRVNFYAHNFPLIIPKTCPEL